MKLSILASLFAVASTTQLAMAQTEKNNLRGTPARDLSILDLIAGGGGDGDETPPLPILGNLENLDMTQLMAMLGMFIQNQALEGCSPCECTAKDIMSQVGLDNVPCVYVELTMPNVESAEPRCMPEFLAHFMGAVGMLQCFEPEDAGPNP